MTREVKRFIVYDNRTDLPVVVDGTTEECAAAMGLTLESFRCAVSRSRKGLNKRWTILEGEVDYA